MRQLVIVFVIGAGLAPALHSQQADSSSQTPPAGSRFGGIWTFNKDLSTDVSGFAPQPPGDPVGRSGASGGRSGGRGGYGRSGGRGGGAPDLAQSLKQRAILREYTTVPERLTVVVKEHLVEFTDQDGLVRKFDTTDKKQPYDLGTATVDAQAKWSGDVLTVTLSADTSKLTETYQLTVQGNMLVEELALQLSGRANGTPPAKRIFDRATTSAEGNSPERR